MRAAFAHSPSPMEMDPRTAASTLGNAEVPRRPIWGTIWNQLQQACHRYEKYSGMALFGLGFLWDSLTLTRIDNLLDNGILLSYLIVIGILIVLILKGRDNGSRPCRLDRARARFPWVLQFLFGGLFSSYVIFYFKSSSFTRTQVFFLILVILWIGNEFLQHRLQNRVLLSILYTFCLLSFFAFFLPVILASVHITVFLLAGGISLIASFGTFALGLKTRETPWREAVRPVAPWIAGTLLTVNVLYFAGLIPPVPLAVKSAGIYHHVARDSDGYAVTYVRQPFYRFWKRWDDPFYLSPGESVYCFTSIFAPAHIHVPVQHIWSRKMATGDWAQSDRIQFQIAGGREGGFRGYTRKKSITPGRWRVEVQTASGQILGRIDFTVIPSPKPRPPLKTDHIR